MRPISQADFGSGLGKLMVRFHDGVSSTYGYVVKQLGTSKFKVSTPVDPTITYDVTLAKTTAEATSLTAGKCTIAVTPFGGGTEYVNRITANHVFTTAGNQYGRTFGTTVAGQAQVEGIPSAPSMYGTSMGATKNVPNNIDFTSNVSGIWTVMVLKTPPAHGTVTISGAVATYTPTTNYTGSDTFLVAFIGPGGQSNISGATLTVA